MAKAIIDTLKSTDSSKEEIIVYPRTIVEAIKNGEGTQLDRLLDNKINLPIEENGNVIHGAAGQFAVSDGTGGITWVTIVDGDEVGW